MSNIGQLREFTTKPNQFQGTVSTLMFSLVFEARPAASSENANAPTHRLYAFGNAGDEVEVGAMWKKTSTRAEYEGETFFTLSFSDPSMEKPINAAAYKDKDKPGIFNITFRHRTAAPARGAPARAPTAAPPAGATFDNESDFFAPER